MNVMTNAAALTRYATLAPHRNYPPEVMLAAKKSLIDWLGVCIGARGEAPAVVTSEVARSWQTAGRAPLLTGGLAAAPLAALVNGTLSHCLDYDDTHVGAVFHASGPIWAAALAVAAEQSNVSETLLLSAVISGFECGVRLGRNGLGVRLNGSGWHTTGVIGVVACALTSAILMSLSDEQAEQAMAIAASQASGLVASFGTMVKPLHPGKAAMDGVMSAQLAAAGLTGAPGLFDTPDGLLPTLLQDKQAVPVLQEEDSDWEILRNSFKPYSACQLTHAAIDCALELAPQLDGAPVEQIRARVHPLAIKIAGILDPKTPTEGRFSLPFCIALGLKAHLASPDDFTPERIADSDLRALAERVVLVSDPLMERVGTKLEIDLIDGNTLQSYVSHALGNPENPMELPALQTKFLALVQPVLGAKADELVALCSQFEEPGSLQRLLAVLADLPEIKQ